jgi:hypothetical protein
MMTECVSVKILAPGCDVPKSTSRPVDRSYFTHMEDGQNRFFPPSLEFAVIMKVRQLAMQRPHFSRGVSFENDEHRFGFINVRRDKEVAIPEAELYGAHMEEIADSAGYSVRRDRRKIICKPWQTEVGSCALSRYPEAADPSVIAVLKEFHVHAE